jgi:hypothetical protein
MNATLRSTIDDGHLTVSEWWTKHGGGDAAAVMTHNTVLIGTRTIPELHSFGVTVTLVHEIIHLAVGDPSVVDHSDLFDRYGVSEESSYRGTVDGFYRWLKDKCPK